MMDEVRQLLDRDLVARVVNRQARLTDLNEHDAWIDECLTEDVEWRYPALAKLVGDGTNTEAVVGRELVRKAVKEMAYVGRAQGSWYGTHLLNINSIEIDGDTAHVSTDVVWFALGDTPNSEAVAIGAVALKSNYRILSVARWNDQLARGTDGSWRIAVRRPERLGS
jgi:hypothetical protein